MKTSLPTLICVFIILATAAKSQFFEKEHTIQGETEMSVVRNFVKKNMEIKMENNNENNPI